MAAKTTIKISAEARDVLRESNLAMSGVFLYIPNRQLGRSLYVEISKALGKLGGKWNTAAGAFKFEKDVTVEFNALRGDGEVVDEKVLYQAFYTPEPVVEKMLRLARLKKGDRVLEPSAGDGRIAIAAAKEGADVVAVEVRQSEAERIPRGDNIHVVSGDFLSIDPSRWAPFDAILMNPPFSKQQDIDHVLHAIKFLRRVPRGELGGGALIAIVGAGFEMSRTKKAAALSEKLCWFSFVKIHKLPEGSFKESGTNVRAVMIEAW